MQIIVAIKSVIDVELNLRVENGQFSEAGLNRVLSKWDENALEAALQIKEATAGEVTVVSIGAEHAQEALRRALAMGADKAVHVHDAAAEGSDALGIARILSAVARRGSYDLVITGRQSQDLDMGATSAYLAVQLGIPWAGNIAELDPNCSQGQLQVKRKGDTGTEVLHLPLPCLITANDSLNEPRLSSLRGIMQARQKPLETLNLADLGIAPTQVGAAAAGYEVVEWMLPPTRAAGQSFSGDAVESANAVAELLATEAKLFA